MEEDEYVLAEELGHLEETPEVNLWRVEPKALIVQDDPILVMILMTSNASWERLPLLSSWSPLEMAMDEPARTFVKFKSYWALDPTIDGPKATGSDMP